MLKCMIYLYRVCLARETHSKPKTSQSIVQKQAGLAQDENVGGGAVDGSTGPSDLGHGGSAATVEAKFTDSLAPAPCPSTGTPRSSLVM
jgi:hypothetical protein